jgi:NADPH:quinone reductase-like Zn-dependent oxidoreductase
MRAVHLTAYGNPHDSLDCVEVPEPAPPQAGEVLIGVEYSPINRNDFAVARGYYPFHPQLPSVIGNEGVGKILAVGPGVTHLAVGDRVLTPLFHGSWVERLVAPAEGLFALPPDADPQQLSMLGMVSPTAALLLSEFVDLKPGEWVTQNAANSGVGRAVIAFARKRGLKTVNLVRRREPIGGLEEAGGDLVLVDTNDALKTIAGEIGGQPLRLAFDGVAGASTASLARLISQGGTIVCHGAVSHVPLSIDGLDVMFKQITLRGFFLRRPEYAPKIKPAVIEAAAMIGAGQLRFPVAAVYPISAIRKAVAHAERGGKVLLDMISTF